MPMRRGFGVSCSPLNVRLSSGRAGSFGISKETLPPEPSSCVLYRGDSGSRVADSLFEAGINQGWLIGGPERYVAQTCSDPGYYLWLRAIQRYAPGVRYSLDYYCSLVLPRRFYQKVFLPLLNRGFPPWVPCWWSFSTGGPKTMWNGNPLSNLCVGESPVLRAPRTLRNVPSNWASYRRAICTTEVLGGEGTRVFGVPRRWIDLCCEMAERTIKRRPTTDRGRHAHSLRMSRTVPDILTYATPSPGQLFVTQDERPWVFKRVKCKPVGRRTPRWSI